MGIKIFVGNTGYSEAGGKKWENKGIKNFGIFLVLRRKTGMSALNLAAGIPFLAPDSEKNRFSSFFFLCFALECLHR